jgi:glutathione S-transferase
MAVKLHHCSLTFMKVPGHPCASVRKALDEAGIAYEIVKHPVLPRSKRTELQRLTGQLLLPAIELEDGTVYREESKEMIARIRAGKLHEAR